MLSLSVLALQAQPGGRIPFNDGWKFNKADAEAFAAPGFDDSAWRTLSLPHDWGVEGPFEQVYPGETGKLAWWGTAWYRKHFSLSAEDLSGQILLEIDGAMSNARVWCNGKAVGGWPYGYASFAVDLSGAVREGENVLAVRLDNPENSSRWYPGGGIYRNVWLTRSDPVGIAHWGIALTTPEISDESATVQLVTTLRNASGVPASGRVETLIYYDGTLVVQDAVRFEAAEDGFTVQERLTVPSPRRWSPADPQLYTALTSVTTDDGCSDTYTTRFGIRSARWQPDGFYLNGERTFLKGVCLHHDAGALGAVWNEDIWRLRLEQLREMGCNAIRTAHNPPAPELLDLCDELGFLVMDELTDTWTVPKKPNGYALLFDKWAERDLVAMIRRDRNHPSVILWSIGNEVGEQGYADKWYLGQWLSDICHREDPTRPTTSGNDNLWAASQDYVRTVDVYGFNYKPHAYAEFRDSHPGTPFLGSETASCISTRGYYRFPVSDEKGEGWNEGAPFQVSSYDLYAPGWASKPDYEWYYEDQVPECAGEFVWTGFDYLGEPTPYNVDWSILTNFHDPEEKARAEAALREQAQTPPPARSSYFGIIDLAGFPKDRYWLYQARWREDLPVAHIVPHWTWPGREGQVTPVHVYTNGDEAELFLNGKSLGRKQRGALEYRLRWDDVLYRKGTLRVVCYKGGVPWAEAQVVTAGAPARLVLEKSRENVAAGGVLRLEVRVTDRKGVVVPDADNLLTWSVSGDAQLVAADAGDPTSHIPFYSAALPAFHGLASALVRRTGPGPFSVTVAGEGLKAVTLQIPPER